MRSARYATRYIPNGPTMRTIEHPELKAVIYTYTMGGSGRLAAVAYSGKRNKPDFHNSFASEDHRDRTIAAWLNGLRNHADRIEARRERKREESRRPNPFKVGDILHYSWGYEQTQCEFYQVTAIKARTVEIRRIASNSSGETGFMSGTRAAIKDAFLEDKPTLTKVVQWYGDGHYYLSMDFGSANLWDGKPKYESWYG